MDRRATLSELMNFYFPWPCQNEIREIEEAEVKFGDDTLIKPTKTFTFKHSYLTS